MSLTEAAKLQAELNIVTLERDELAKERDAALLQVGKLQGCVQELSMSHQAALLQVEELKNKLTEVSAVWGQSWDCSAHPGHQAMHDAIGRVEEFLEKKEGV